MYGFRKWIAAVVLCVGWVAGSLGQDWSLQFNGTSQQVGFGAATAALGASTFTIECWFKRTGAGATTTTGTGGITAVPLVAKGRGEADGTNKDCNYFFGITTANVLGADFEEGAGQTSPGLNHPVTGSTTIVNDQWYHGAVTFDGTTWRLYLNGDLDATLDLGANRLPRSDSIQHASLATALTSTGAAAGFFAGRLDEVRIWNHARSQAELLATLRAKVPTATGLLARWSLDEGTGTTVASTAGTTVNGTLVNTPTWSIDTPFAAVPAGSVWKYLDNGSNQGTSWRAPAFDDSVWASGPAELGYGDGGEATVVGYGPDAANKYITTYLRHAFQVTDATRYSGLDVSLVRDDGAVVYLNGVEVLRSNMPSGDILYNTVAASPEVSGTDESKWFNHPLPSAAFVEGLNVLAVEVHQQRVGSSDVSFNLKLAVSRTDTVNLSPAVALTAPAAGAALPMGTPVTLTADASDTDGAVALVEFFANGSKVGEASVAPFACEWTPTTAGRAALTAKATDNGGAATTTAAVNANVYETGTGALQFDGSDDHVTFGTATDLGASAFTLECWMRRLGPGITSSSGNGGVSAVPLIAKGRGENENSNVDCNYFFGLLPSGALAADFEQLSGVDGDAGQNYPVTGVSTAPGDGQWHHVAVTYDGSNWVLYVDGAVDRTLSVGSHTPRFDSIQHAALGTAMNSSGVREGAFDGVLDEARIWNYARSAAQLAATRDKAVAAANGLLGRWSLDEATGATAANSISGKPAGTLVNGPLWCLGRTLEAPGPATPVVSLTAPADGATVSAGTELALAAEAFDDDGSIVSVAFLAGETELGSAATAPYGFAWTAVPEGTHALRAVATDNDGRAATSTVATVTAVVRNDPPVLSGLAPADGASVAGGAATLQATVADPEGQPLTVRFRGRVRTQQPPAPDFTVVVLPDTQYYSKSYPQNFSAQTDWIVAQRTARNIAYVAHLGDITEDATEAAAQWLNASNALARLENPATTGLPHGIPYGVVPGNHDHTSGIALYNQNFGTSRFQGRPYYGGYFGSDNRNHYDLFSAGGMDFLFVYVDFNYGGIANYAELNAWANGVIQAHPNRRAVVVSHAIIDTAANFNADNGQALYNAVKDNANLFLTLNGHYHGEAHRIESVGGRRVDLCLSDYQGYANGGNGFLRLYEFSPSNNVIRVKTYSPTLDQYETDAASQFEIPCAMAAPADPTPFSLIGTAAGLASGSTASVAWQSLDPATEYEWYVEADDGVHSVTGALRAFTTDAAPEPVVSVSNPYADVDWATVGTLKGNLHTHTTQSDGNQDPWVVIDGYQAQGYDFLAITDHDKVTYPWTSHGSDPLVVGMTDIQGNELSQGHHIVSLFSGYASSSADAGVLLAGVANAGGISFFAHPGRYSYNAQWYADYYTAQPSCIGMEIYNQGDRYPGDRIKWDQVLTVLMPARPVWGFSNDDSHDASHIGRNRTYLLAPSDSHASVRSALEQGAFFATYSTASAHVPPMLTNVVVDAVAGAITVQGTGYTQVRWISQGSQVATGETLDLINTPGVAKYVRAELHGAEGIGYTNPFGLQPTGNQAPTVAAGSDQAITLPAGATLAGSASDDGLPSPPAVLTLLWEEVSGPGTVTFADDAAAQTTATFSEAGTYVLRLTATDGTLSAADDVTITVNDAGGPTGWTAYNDCSWASGQLDTRITTYGLNQSGAMVAYATGAALPVSLQIVNNPAAPANANGTGGPMPNAGTDAYNTFNGIVSFANVIWYGNTGWWVDAVVTGLDPNRRYEFATSVNRGNATYTTRWSKFTLSGADAATQASTSGVQVNSDTSVSFWVGNNSANGHVARWTEIRPGSDGSFTVRAEADGQFGHSTQQAYAFDGLLLRDLGPAAPGNVAPTVSAGSDQAITLPADATLSGSAVDDGLPTPPAALTLLWEQVSGPGTVTFADPAAAQTTATFAEAGTYVLRLTANDGALSAADDVTVTVNAAALPGISFGPNGTGTLTFDSLPPVNEWTTGSIGTGKDGFTTDTGLDAGVQALNQSAVADALVSDTNADPLKRNRAVWTSGGSQFIQISATSVGAVLLKGTLFNNSGVPVSSLRVAYDYTVVETSAEEVPGLRVFYSLTGASGSWTPIPAFSGLMASQALETTLTFGTPWQPGAQLFLMWADDNSAADTERKYRIDNFAVGLGVNQAPIVSAGANQTITLPAGATLDGSANDDGLPTPPAAMTLLWEQVSGPGTVTFADAAATQTTATFVEAGTYVLRLTANDGALSASAETTVTVLPEGSLPGWTVSNPYANVSWGTYGTFKGNLHTHTTQSDGNQDPWVVIDGYQAQDYDFLALTDHDKVTYPWTSHGSDPLVVGMTDIQGNELSQGHHIVSLFSGYASSSADAGVLLAGVANAGGISFFAHPGRYSYNAQWYADYYTAQPSCIGMEIYNQGDRYPGDRIKWDQVLTVLMPARPVWGFSNDDSHDASHIGRNRTYLLAPSDSHASVRSALEQGAFFATYSTASAHVPPMLTNVVVDAVAGAITVQGTGYTQVRWISQGSQVATGETLDLINTPGVAKYVRAELHGAEGIGYTNPFGLQPTGNQAPTVAAGSDQAITLPAGATLAGSASDDGLPSPPAVLTLLWEEVSGPGTVTFADDAAAQTTATFSEAGTYVLRLTATDGSLSASAEVTVTVESAPTPEPASWVAYNDCVFQEAATKHANATVYNIGSGSPGPANGALRDLASGTVLPVTVTLTQTGGVVWQPDPVTGGSDCAAGTDADRTFGGIVNMGGVVYYGSAGWTVDATITGLDPDGVYEFATSANRNNASYQNRRSVYTLQGADAFHAASTPGVVVAGASATLNTGDNTATGYVARWIGIRPGSDGSFTVRATHAPDVESGNKAYAFDVFLLRRAAGFHAWAQTQGHAGAPADLFGHVNGANMPLGLEYACGANLRTGEPLLTVRNVGGRPVIDVPAQDPSSVPHVRLVIEGTPVLGGPWTLPVRSAADTTGKPGHRAWFEAETDPTTAFFRLVAQPLD